MLFRVLAIISLCLGLSSASANFAIFQTAGSAAITCAFNDNINNYSPNNTGLVDTAASFSSFHTAALAWQTGGGVGTYCLTIPPGTYFLGGTGASVSWAAGIKNLYVSGYGGVTLTDNIPLPTNASAGIGTNTLTFASLPSGVISGMQVVDITHPTAIVNTPSTQTHATISGSTATIDVAVASPGVSSGDTILFIGSGGAIGAGINGANFGDNTHYINLATVSAGSTTATASCSTAQCTTNLGNCSTLFHNGDWAMVSGLDMQANNNFPPNPFYWEWVQITNVNCGTGVFTLSAPLQFTYLSTWPNYDAGGSGAVYEGGPATIYAIRQEWVINQTYAGMTLDSQAGQLKATGHTLVFQDCQTTGYGVPLSEVQTETWTNCPFAGGDIEVDKLWSNVTVNGGTSHGWAFQSASANGTLTLNNHHVTFSFNGSPGKLVLTGGTQMDPGLSLGAEFYGLSNEVDCTNSTISVGVGVHDTGDPIFSLGGATMTAGVITVPRTWGAPLWWAIPGMQVAWRCRYRECGTFTIVSITADATNTYVTTDQVGTQPSFGGTITGISGIAARKVNFSNCSGSDDAVDLSQPGAQNKPLWSYSKRTVPSVSQTPFIPVWGTMTNVNIDVTVAGNAVDAEIGNGGIFYLDSTGTQQLWNPTVRVSNPGGTPHNVAITPTTVTGTQTGDSVSAPGSGSWFVDNQIQLLYSAAPGSAATTIEIITDQGIH